MSIDIKSSKLPSGNNGIASKLPISVVAGNRPFYLFRMLYGLLSTPGVNKQMVTVYIDGFHEIVKDVVQLFDVKYINHIPGCQYSCRISEVLLFSFSFSMGRFFIINHIDRLQIILRELNDCVSLGLE